MAEFILKAKNSSYEAPLTKVFKIIWRDYLTSLNLTKQDALPKSAAESKTNKVYGDPFPRSVILLTVCCLVSILIMLVFGVIYLISRERKRIKPMCAESESKSVGDDVFMSQSEKDGQDYEEECNNSLYHEITLPL
jgi:hypothetical protein